VFSGVDTTPTPVRRERRLRLVRLAEVVAAGAIIALAGGATLIEEFGTGALIAAVAGLAALMAASLAAQRLRRAVRYRIDRPNSTAWLTVKVAALLAGLVGTVVVASAVDAPSLSRTVIVVVVREQAGQPAAPSAPPATPATPGALPAAPPYPESAAAAGNLCHLVDVDILATTSSTWRSSGAARPPATNGCGWRSRVGAHARRCDLAEATATAVLDGL